MERSHSAHMRGVANDISLRLGINFEVQHGLVDCNR